MSTKCYVGKLNLDNTVSAIYIHCDGYLSGVGRVLLENYKSESIVDKLLSLGSLSSLGEEPISSSKAWDSSLDIFSYSGCRAYKDRGEENCEAQQFESERNYLYHINNTYAEYAYLYKDGKWFWTKPSAKAEFKLLTEETIREDN